MAARRVMAIAALVGVSFVATAAADSAALYSLAATEACLEGLPNAVRGLPPASPPLPPAPFVYRLPPDRFLPPVLGQLGAWRAHGKSGYAGVILSFFRNVRSAQTYLESVLSGSGVRMRNVVLDWGDTRNDGWRDTVRGCVRSGPPAGGTPAAARSTLPASLATFAGYWGGHTRGLRISSTGRGVEITDSGCCHRVYRMTLQVISVRGSVTAADAVYRVTSFRRYDRAVPKLHTGRIGKLLLRNGIVTNTLTSDFFCSDPAWWATGACGA